MATTAEQIQPDDMTSPTQDQHTHIQRFPPSIACNVIVTKPPLLLSISPIYTHKLTSRVGCIRTGNMAGLVPQTSPFRPGCDLYHRLHHTTLPTDTDTHRLLLLIQFPHGSWLTIEQAVRTSNNVIKILALFDSNFQGRELAFFPAPLLKLTPRGASPGPLIGFLDEQKWVKTVQEYRLRQSLRNSYHRFAGVLAGFFLALCTAALDLATRQ
jgi:hypothetical protein